MLPDSRFNRAQTQSAGRKTRGWFILGAAVASGGIAGLAAASASGPFAGLHVDASRLVRSDAEPQKVNAAELFPAPSARVVHQIVSVYVKPKPSSADPESEESSKPDLDDMARPTPSDFDEDDDDFGKPSASPTPMAGPTPIASPTPTPSPTPPVASPSPSPSASPCVSTPTKPC